MQWLSSSSLLSDKPLNIYVTAANWNSIKEYGGMRWRQMDSFSSPMLCYWLQRPLWVQQGYCTLTTHQVCGISGMHGLVFLSVWCIGKYSCQHRTQVEVLAHPGLPCNFIASRNNHQKTRRHTEPLVLYFLKILFSSKMLRSHLTNSFKLYLLHDSNTSAPHYTSV